MFIERIPAQHGITRTRVREYVLGFFAAEHCAPSVRQIARALKKSPGTVYYHTSVLVAEGTLWRNPHGQVQPPPYRN